MSTCLGFLDTLDSGFEMPNRKIIVIGGSAGCSRATRENVTSFPKDFPAAVFVAVHRGLLGGVDWLPSSLDRLGNLYSALARDNETLEVGRVYVAPCIGHLLVEQHRVRIEPTGDKRE